MAEMWGPSTKWGWLQVEPEAVDDEALAFRLDTALAYNRRSR